MFFFSCGFLDSGNSFQTTVYVPTFLSIMFSCVCLNIRGCFIRRRTDSVLEDKEEGIEDEKEDGYDDDEVFGNDDDPFQQYDDDEEYDDPDDDAGGDAYF